MRAAGGAEPRAARPCGDILCAAKSNCIVENAETGQQEMDAKNTVVYLDTIKQIMSVNRQAGTCGKRKRSLRAGSIRSIHGNLCFRRSGLCAHRCTHVTKAVSRARQFDKDSATAVTPHTQTGPPVSATRPSLILFSRPVCPHVCDSDSARVPASSPYACSSPSQCNVSVALVFVMS